jgi:hypothetical protein
LCLIQVTYANRSSTYNDPVPFAGVITMRLTLTLTTALVVMFASLNTAEACTIIAVGKKEFVKDRLKKTKNCHGIS